MYENSYLAALEQALAGLRAVAPVSPLGRRVNAVVGDLYWTTYLATA